MLFRSMLKSKKALIVGGKQALDSVGAKMEESLKAAGVEPYFYTMTSDCTYETLDYLQNTLIPQQKFDLVIGSGGGKVASVVVSVAVVSVAVSSDVASPEAALSSEELSPDDVLSSEDALLPDALSLVELLSEAPPLSLLTTTSSAANTVALFILVIATVIAIAKTPLIFLIFLISFSS